MRRTDEQSLLDRAAKSPRDCDVVSADVATTDDVLLETGPSVYRFDHEDPPQAPADIKPASPTTAAATLRLRPNTLAQMANRDGDHFTVLEQSDGAPMLRDFPSAEELVEYLKEQSGFRALLQPDSDEGLEMQRSATRSRYREEKSGSESDTSSTSSASTLSGITPAKVMWIDIQCSDHDVIESLLSVFPRIEPETFEDMRLQDAPDTVHWFSRQRYLFANIECTRNTTNNNTFTLMNSHRPLSTTESSTILSIIAFSDVFITVHSCPIAGHREALQALHEVVSARRRSQPGSPKKSASPSTSKRGAQLAPTPKPPVHTHTVKKKKRLTVGIILATLVESLVIATLPDPTVCLSEVDRIDEMVLLVTQDQHDLLRRIARTRRELSTQRAKLYRKERLLQTFTTPALRASFVSAVMAEQYRHLLGEIYHVAERLEAARDALTQANSNFVSHISLQVSQTSNHMNTKMKALSQVATICMPLNIITGLFGMNVTIPYNTTDYPSTLVPFAVILAVMALFLMIGIPVVWRGLIRDKHLHSQSEGMVTVAIDD